MPEFGIHGFSNELTGLVKKFLLLSIPCVGLERLLLHPLVHANFWMSPAGIIRDFFK